MFGWAKNKLKQFFETETSHAQAFESGAETTLNAVALTKKAGSIFSTLKGTLKTAFKTVAKRVPVLGAVVTAGFVVAEATKYAIKGDWSKAGASIAVGAPEIAGNFIGFGVGDICREAARGAFIKFGGDKYKDLERSDILTLVKYGAESTGLSKYFNKKSRDGYPVVQTNSIISEIPYGPFTKEESQEVRITPFSSQPVLVAASQQKPEEQQGQPDPKNTNELSLRPYRPFTEEESQEVRITPFSSQPFPVAASQQRPEEQQGQPDPKNTKKLLKDSMHEILCPKRPTADEVPKTLLNKIQTKL